MKNNKAFTLIELLVVIAVIGLLTTVVLVSLSGIKADGRDAKRQQDLKSIALAMEVYNGTEGSYLPTTAGTNTVPSIGTYLSQLPTDPTGGDLQYTWTESDGSYYCLYSKLEGVDNTYYCVSNLGNSTKSGDGYVPSNTDCCGYNLTGGTEGGEPEPWACGDTVTFTYNGEEVTYGTVESLSECWLDRNLGALQVATAYNDSLAYGDLFQWGRLDDGHQERDSSITTTLSSDDNPGHSNFIRGSSLASDWRDPQNNNLWQGVDGINNPCPEGWEIPTDDEWNTERQSWDSNDKNGAFSSFLKLTAGGVRFYDGALSSVDNVGSYWSSGLFLPGSSFLQISSNASMSGTGRTFGHSVRCIKD